MPGTFWQAICDYGRYSAILPGESAVFFQIPLLCHLRLPRTLLCWLSGRANSVGAKGYPPPASSVADAPLPAISYSAVHVNGPFIAMTFDDGPSAKLTPELLDILAAHHIHATFFVIGQNAAEYPEILQRAVREGHEVGNHSWSHPAFGKMRDDRVRAELQKHDRSRQRSVVALLMRPPYGSITARQKQWINAEFGYRTILWDVDPLDWKRPGAAVVGSRIVRETRPGINHSLP